MYFNMRSNVCNAGKIYVVNLTSVTHMFHSISHESENWITCSPAQAIVVYDATRSVIVWNAFGHRPSQTSCFVWFVIGHRPFQFIGHRPFIPSGTGPPPSLSTAQALLVDIHVCNGQRPFIIIKRAQALQALHCHRARHRPCHDLWHTM